VNFEPSFILSSRWVLDTMLSPAALQL